MTCRYRFISAHRADWGVTRGCRVLTVARSGFYRWLAGEPIRAARATARGRPREGIRTVHDGSGGSYGSPRVVVELRARGRW